MEALLPITYIAFFLFLIGKINFFKEEGLSSRSLAFIFFLKIIFGTLLWYIYTYYYTDRSTADIYKYFDDSKIIFDALHTNPTDYFQILFGIKNDTPYFDEHYYTHMNYWYRKFDSNLYNDSHTIIRFNALLRLFSFGNYHVHTVFVCFLSLIGLTAIYKTFIVYMKDRKQELFFAIFLFPSVLFWGSGVLKESLLFLGLGLLVYCTFKSIQTGPTLKYTFIVFLSGLLIAFTKFYILVALLPVLTFLIVIKTGSKKFLFMKFVTTLIFFVFVGVAVQYAVPQYNPFEILSIKQRDFTNLASGGIYLYDTEKLIIIAPEDRGILEPLDSTHYKIKKGSNFFYLDIKNDFKDTTFIQDYSDTAGFTLLADNPRSGSLIKMNKLQPNVISFLKNAPIALANVFVRPHLFDSQSLLILLSALENLIILICLTIALFFYRKNMLHPEIPLFCIGFVCILFTIIGVTVPILGAIVRYKVPALPFLLIFTIYIADLEKLYGKLNLRKRLKIPSKY